MESGEIVMCLLSQRFEFDFCNMLLSDHIFTSVICEFSLLLDQHHKFPPHSSCTNRSTNEFMHNINHGMMNSSFVYYKQDFAIRKGGGGG